MRGGIRMVTFWTRQAWQMSPFEERLATPFPRGWEREEPLLSSSLSPRRPVGSINKMPLPWGWCLRLLQVWPLNRSYFLLTMYSAIKAFTCGNPSPLFERIFFLQDKSSFESNTVTKPVVTQATTRHQMKDMDIIFPLVTLSFLSVKWFGFYSLSKSSIFSKG